MVTVKTGAAFHRPVLLQAEHSTNIGRTRAENDLVADGWFAAVAFAVMFGFYLLLAGSLNWTELAAAVACAAAVSAFMTLQRACQARPITLALPPARVLCGTLASLLMDSGRVGFVLLRAIGSRAGGNASWQGFHPGGRNPDDAGRRALVTLLTSLAPNGFVLDLRPSALPEADHGLLLHRLSPAPPLSGKDWPS